MYLSNSQCEPRCFPTKLWSVYAHDDGVYSVDLNDEYVVSGGEEGGVRVWGRADGALLSTLCHHDYIVWNVSFWLDRLFTCSYDCTVAYLSPRGLIQLKKIVLKSHLRFRIDFFKMSRYQFFLVHGQRLLWFFKPTFFY